MPLRRQQRLQPLTLLLTLTLRAQVIARFNQRLRFRQRHGRANRLAAQQMQAQFGFHRFAQFPAASVNRQRSSAGNNRPRLTQPIRPPSNAVGQ